MKHPKATDDGPFARARHGGGVRPPTTRMPAYELVVLAIDASEVVRHAGGWIYDRVRAGWRVTVWVKDSADLRALQILGARIGVVDVKFPATSKAVLASVAVSGRLLHDDPVLHSDVSVLTGRSTVEVSIWGDPPPELTGGLHNVTHRLSAAATVFKSQAHLAAGLVPEPMSTVEDFRSCGLWYPTGGPDLTICG